ncbi:Uncharacterized protein dnm_053420 [Desulfonema magnum]|uniref:Uncharacterized protein n=1 Tax=Desulfonema magnum TaxID=45655 RepID=A0A975GPW7_9BACT|nr:Uncharacterized protein dnm_053420 [Desulfonema magnum]
MSYGSWKKVTKKIVCSEFFCDKVMAFGIFLYLKILIR